MPPTSGRASGARPEYRATLRASFRMTSPPSIIHSPFAPSVSGGYADAMWHRSLKYASRIEGWLTRPCHFAANRRMPRPRPRRRQAGRPGLPCPSCPLTDLTAYAAAGEEWRLHAPAQIRCGSRNGSPTPRPTASSRWSRRTASQSMRWRWKSSGPARSASPRFMSGRHANGNFPAADPAFLAAGGFNAGALLAAIRPARPECRRAGAGTAAARSRRHRQPAARAAAFSEPQPLAGGQPRRRLRGAAVARQRQAQTQEAPLADAQVRGCRRLPPHRGKHAKKKCCGCSTPSSP